MLVFPAFPTIPIIQINIKIKIIISFILEIQLPILCRFIFFFIFIPENESGETRSYDSIENDRQRLLTACDEMEVRPVSRTGAGAGVGTGTASRAGTGTGVGTGTVAANAPSKRNQQTPRK